MRQVFSSPRLENVERVAALLNEHGIQTRVTNGRSYRGSRRGSFSYRESPEGDVRPAVWVVTSDDQPKAREILREMGLLDSGRSPTSYLPTPHDVRGEDEIAARKRKAFRIKSGLLLAIAVAMAIGFLSSRKAPPAATHAPTAAAPVAKANTHVVDTPTALAAMLIDVELRAHDSAQACLSVDGKDPSERVLEQLKADRKRLRPAGRHVAAVDRRVGVPHRRLGHRHRAPGHRRPGSGRQAPRRRTHPGSGARRHGLESEADRALSGGSIVSSSRVHVPELRSSASLTSALPVRPL